MQYRSHTYAESTKGTYRTYRDSYLRFCQFAGFDPVPATTLSICHYVAFLARSMKVSSIRNYLGIISLLHKEFGLSNPLTDNWPLKSLLLGIKRVKGGEVEQKLTITPNILLGIYSKLNMLHSFDVSFWAICLTAFYGMFRKSHLVPTSAATFDPNKQFCFRDVTFFSWGALLEVRWSKTIQFRERVVQIPLPFISGSPLCPCTALAKAFSFTSHKAKPESHAFSWLDHRTLLIQCLTYRAFLSKLKSLLTMLGYDPAKYAGHSFRRGGASYAFQVGVPLELIKITGDWKSSAVSLYLTLPENVKFAKFWGSDLIICIKKL